MSYFAITAQYSIFTDLDGTPLENGYVWIGEENENPITNPITIYWDSDLQTPASQPIRTLAGAPNRNGSPAQLYCATDFSILVQDRNSAQIYYSGIGVKNYTSASLGDRTNYIPNGLFLVQQENSTTREISRWYEKSATYSIISNRLAFYNTYHDRPKDNIKFYIRHQINGTPAATSDYARWSCMIEDVSKLSGKTITLSWFDRYLGLEKYAVSMSQIMPTKCSLASITGIGAEIFYPGSTFLQKSLTVNIPSIATEIDFGDEEDDVTGGFLINFWFGAGADYNSETNNLGHYNLSGSKIELADIRLNIGSIIITDNDKSFQEEYRNSKRYYEKSTAYYDKSLSGFSGNLGYITHIAGGTGTTIPGFRFTEEKRNIDDLEIHVYSNDSGTVDTVYHVGVGDIAISSYNDYTTTGVGSITLSSGTVAGDAYQYHWSADNEYSE